MTFSTRLVLVLALSAFCVCATSVTAESAAANAAQPLAMTEKRKIIQERAAALADFSGVSAQPASWSERYAKAALEGKIHFDDDIIINTGLKNIDWNGGQYPHVEWGQSLNRFFHLRPLASMYLKTRDEKYAQAARSYIEDWIDAAKGAPMEHDNSLTLALRMDRWETALAACLESPSFDDAFVEKMLNSISSQAEQLSHNLAGTNFRVAGLDGLILTALRLPFLPNADKLLSIGVLGMRANLATQFLPDGVHVERTPGYHGGMVEMAAKYVSLGRQFPEADPHVDLDLMKRAIDYSALSALSALNDSHYYPRDPTEEDQRADVRWSRALREMMPERTFDAQPPLEMVFPNAGHVFSRSSWEPGADYLAFDAGTWGSGHDHLSRLGFMFRAGGRVLVADPGCFTYEMSDPFASYGRSTPAHSTLNLNGFNQSNVDAQLLRAEFTPATALIQGRYQGGYWPGRYTWGFGGRHGQGVAGVHDRTLLWVKGEYLLALDTMTADLDTTVHNVWQMGAMEAWEKDESSMAWWSKNEDQNLYAQLIPLGLKPEMQCFEGSKEPMRGWVARSQTENTPAPQVEFTYPCDYVCTSAVLLAPFKGNAKPTYTVKSTGKTYADEAICEVMLGLPSGGTDLVAWTGTLTTALENLPSTLNSDATFVWLRLDATGKPAKAYLLDGSFLSFQGKIIYEGKRREAKLVEF